MKTRTPMEEGRRRRLIGWSVFYVILLVSFALVLYRQTRQVNTYQLASGHILLTTSKSSYTAGDTVSYTIFNQLNSVITLKNKCPNEPLNVYEWKKSKWQPIHAKSSSACKSPSSQVIQPGKSYKGSYADWQSLFNSPGIYRIALLASNYNGLAYADFDVVAKPVANTQPQAPKIIIKNVYTPIYVPVPTTYGGDTGGGGGSDN